MPVSTRFPVIVTLIALTAVACERADDPDRAGEPPPDTAVAPAAVPAADAPARAPGVGADTREIGADPAAARVTGEARLEERPDGGASIVVSLQGLDAGALYPVTLHQGSCAHGGPVRVPLGRITARADGTGSLRMVLAEGQVPASPLFARAIGPSGGPVACADIETP